MSTKVVKIILEILYCIGLMIGTYFLANFILGLAWNIHSGSIWLSAIIMALEIRGIL